MSIIIKIIKKKKFFFKIKKKKEMSSSESSSSSSRLKLGFICFDVEATGEFIALNDEVFAIGIVSCDAKNPTQIKKTLICLNLEKPPDMSWEELWKLRSYDQNCFQEFWSKNLHILDSLQDPTKVKLYNRLNFDRKLNKALQQHEELYEKTLLVTDTTNYDTVCIGHLLSQEGYRALNYTRAGKHRSGVHLKSYLAGLAGVSDPSDSQTIKEFKETFIKPFILEQVEHDHNPANDAHNILLTYVGALYYAECLDTVETNLSKRAREA